MPPPTILGWYVREAFPLWTRSTSSTTWPTRPRSSPRRLSQRAAASLRGEKRTVEGHLERVEEIKANERIRDEIEKTRRPLHQGGAPAGTANSPSDGFGQQLLSSGFDLKSNPSVQLSAFAALAKAPTLPPTTDLNPAAPASVPMGRDSRFLWPTLNRQDAGTNTAVSDFRQTARTVTGNVERAIDATTTKAELDLTIAHVVEPMKQLAVTISSTPNAVLESVDLLRAFFNEEGRFQVEKELDVHVLRQIVAAAPPFGNAGTELVEQVRNGITAMRAEGANPNVLVVNAADAAALDLTADAGGYVFPLRDTGASPLWGVRVIERPGTTPPYLIDTRMLGVLYLGGMSFDADPYSGFKQNLTTLRVETNALFHVRDARGARRIAAT